MALTGKYELTGNGMDICVLPFTATACGSCFQGKTLGQGVDTQRISKDGRMELSARYILEGTDYKGNACRVFIENNGNNDSGKLLCTPQIVTDSEALKEWEISRLTGTVEEILGGVIVRIYKLKSGNGQ